MSTIGIRIRIVRLIYVGRYTIIEFNNGQFLTYKTSDLDQMYSDWCIFNDVNESKQPSNNFLVDATEYFLTILQHE
jgi:hypothetical protein